MPLETLKCSTIFVASGGSMDVFHSVEEIPPAMRQRLLEATHGMQSATILIADRGGREQLLRAAQGESGCLQVRAFSPPPQPPIRRGSIAACRSAILTAALCALAAAVCLLLITR